jgi:hypothetical protein
MWPWSVFLIKISGSFAFILYFNTDDAIIFNEYADGFAEGTGDKVGTPCYTDGRWVRYAITMRYNSYHYKRSASDSRDPMTV